MTLVNNNNKKELLQKDKLINEQLSHYHASQNSVAKINQPLNHINKKILHKPNQNHILNSLPLAESKSIIQHLELVQLSVGKMLCESGERLHYAYFPTSCIISLHHILESGRTSEVAGVGNEGMVGIALFMGGDTIPSSAVVQITGYAYRLESSILKKAFKSNIAFQRLLLRYTQILLTQISLIAVCNRHHNLQQQLCRWLLLTLDRLATNEISMTQELVAGMLGVRRESVTEAASNLQKQGLISYRRGHITVTHRPGIERQVCECYSVIKKQMQTQIESC